MGWLFVLTALIVGAVVIFYNTCRSPHEAKQARTYFLWFMIANQLVTGIIFIRWGM